MTQEQDRKCQVEMYAGALCGRDIYKPDGTRCICHSDQANKDTAVFAEQIVRVRRQKAPNYADFTGFVFPTECCDFRGVFDAEARFDRAVFLGVASFERCRTMSGMSFADAEFRGRAWFHKHEIASRLHFTKAKFHDGMLFGDTVHRGWIGFDNAEIHGVAEFSRARFLGGASFSGAVFGKVAHFPEVIAEQSLDFVGCIFEEEAVFSGVILRGGCDFRDTEFRGVANFSPDEDHSSSETIHTQLGNPTVFSHSTFHDKAEFGRVEFKGRTKLDGTKFLGAANFFSAHFEDTLSARETTFNTWADFSGVQIHSVADFGFSSFREGVTFLHARLGTDARLTFDGEDSLGPVFAGDSDFTDTSIVGDGRIAFRNLAIEECRFILTDVSKIEFLNIEWSFQRRLLWGLIPRRVVADEIYLHELHGQSVSVPPATPVSEYRHVLTWIADVYRGLQRTYIDRLQYSVAGDFYIGEQEMIRKAKGKWRRYLCANNAYRLISLYGESYGLPLLWIAATLFLYPVFLLSNGVSLSPGAPTVNYAFDMSGDFIPLTADYCAAFWKNLTFVTFNRSEIAAHLAEPYQQGMITLESIWIVVLVTFFVLALRRRFRRKSF